ncbi:kinase-like protein [Piedraia hortae CBS 480.64]|uniref:cyclin-dependent kinase n=1 Tax=Piedraia hortae CBS 480.64 TaxID=1314780 RepID=A0A6A7C990_9PEZI|nr:kinase-like protein [Piedraia hortae CBS 480.64]
MRSEDLSTWCIMFNWSSIGMCIVLVQKDLVVVKPGWIFDPQPPSNPTLHPHRSTPKRWNPSHPSLSHLQILNPISSGTYGTVSRALSSQTNTVLAVKQTPLSPTHNNGFPTPTLREITSLHTLSHERIVTLVEAILTPESVYLVMEYLPHDLQSLLASHPGRFTLSETKTLLSHLTSGLGYLHRKWLVHRDIKPSNLLLGPHGLKIADFGSSRLIGEPRPGNLTSVVTTLWYRAPEVLLGERFYGREVDLWATGCVFAELVKCVPVMEGRTETDQLDKISTVCGGFDAAWPKWRALSNAGLVKSSGKKKGALRDMFGDSLTERGLDLLQGLLTLDPEKRLSAEEVLNHEWFTEHPQPKDMTLFPSFPSRAGREKRLADDEPEKPPREKKVHL